MRVTRHVLSVVVLAVLLGLLAFALPGRAEAAEHDAPVVMAEQHQHHNAVMADPGDETPDHADHNCHCISAMCSPVVEPSLAALSIRSPHRVHHDRPVAADARPLASVDPPPRPPRA